MQVNRKKTRKFLFQKLYAMTFAEYNEELFTKSFYENTFRFDIDTEYSIEMIDVIKKHEGFFIEVLKKYSPRFDIKTMNPMYILPVFLCLAEMFFLKEEIPAKISVNEAIEVAKNYWDDSAKKIVNWVLNKVLTDVEELTELAKTDFSNTTLSVFKKIS